MKRLGAFLISNVLTLFLFSLWAQIPNGGFEEWFMEGNENNPLEWETTNNDPIVTVSPYTPAYSGNFSMKVSTYDAGMLIIPGVAAIEFPIAQRPTEINACLKTTVMPGDFVYLIVAMYHEDSIVALPTDCSFSIDSTIGDFTCLSFPITYRSDLVPDSASIIVMAGSVNPQIGTEIVVDDLSFSVSTGIDQKNVATIDRSFNYPNPAEDFTNIPINLIAESDVEIIIWDMNGRIVKVCPFKQLPKGKQNLQINTREFVNGIYPYSVRGRDFSYLGKILVDR